MKRSLEENEPVLGDRRVAEDWRLIPDEWRDFLKKTNTQNSRSFVRSILTCIARNESSLMMVEIVIRNRSDFGQNEDFLDL